MIQSELGRGGFGVVYLAHDLRLHSRPVVIKVLLEENAADDDWFHRKFAQEIEALARIDHPGVVGVLDAGETPDGPPFVVLQFVNGVTLRSALRNGPMDFNDVASIVSQIGYALTAAHECGVWHRDLKPENIMLQDLGQGERLVKIIDFGIASVKEARIPKLDSTAADPTRVAGSVPYMAPEQLTGKPAASSDIYALGVIACEMLIGRRPFRADSAVQLYFLQQQGLDFRLDQVRPGLSPSAHDAVRRALSFDAKDRHEHARDLGDELASTLAEPSARASVVNTVTIEHDSLEMANAGPSRRNWHVRSVAAGAAVLAAGMALAGWLFFSHSAQALNETDTIVLADFANSTGDAVLDGTLKEAYATALQQSPFLSILSDREVSRTLKLMGRSGDAPLDAKTALELCQRTGSKAVLTGSIASLGSQFVIGLNAVNCQTGGSLAREQAQATVKETVLDALDKATAKLRARLGESLTTVRKFDTPLQLATTPSIEALQAYSLGRKYLIFRADPQFAAPLFRQAIRLDPNFAMAHLSLGLTYISLGQDSLGVDSVRRAYELRDRVSDWERFAIESRYFRSAVGDLREARQVYELWAQAYPRELIAFENLAAIDSVLGHFDKTLAESREAVRLGAGAAPYAQMMISYVALNRLEEARAAFQEAQGKRIDNPDLNGALYAIAFLEGDAEGMARQVAWSAGKEGQEDWYLAAEADTAAYSGRLEKARELTRQAVSSALRVREPETAGCYEAEAAVRLGLVGYSSEARQRATAALELSTDRSPESAAALAFALVGDAIRAETLAKDLDKRFPEDTLVQLNYLPAIRGRIAVNGNDAIQLLQAAAPYELGMPDTGCLGAMYPVYVRGEAYLAAHRGSETAAEFAKILDHRGIVGNEPIAALAHLGVARAYGLQGDTAKARSAYEDFLTLWKDADPDIPILKQAKAEYHRYQLLIDPSRRK